MSSQISKCYICHENEESDDAVIECDQCHIKIHPRCYLLGLPSLPDTWLCELCSNNQSNAAKETNCELCHEHKSTLPMKCIYKPNMDDINKYVHVQCAQDKATWSGVGYGMVYKKSDLDQLYTYDIRNAVKISNHNHTSASKRNNSDTIDNSSDNKNTNKRRKTTDNKKSTAAKSASRKSTGNNKFVDAVDDDENNNSGGISTTRHKLIQLQSIKLSKHEQSREVQRFKHELAKFEQLEYLDRREVLKHRSRADIIANDDYQATYDDDSAPCEICGLKYIRDDAAADCEFIICGSEDASKATGCDCTVHNYCNNGPFPVTDDDWYCTSCSDGADSNSLICGICEQGGKPNNVGAFRKIHNYKKLHKQLNLKSEWAHTVCGLYIRGCWLDYSDQSAQIYGVEDIESRDKKICSICHRRGATVMCAEPTCYTPFHPSCALHAGYQLENITPANDESTTSTDNRVIFCKKHNLSNKIERQLRIELNLPLPKCLQNDEPTNNKRPNKRSKSIDNTSARNYITADEMQKARQNKSSNQPIVSVTDLNTSDDNSDETKSDVEPTNKTPAPAATTTTTTTATTPPTSQPNPATSTSDIDNTRVNHTTTTNNTTTNKDSGISSTTKSKPVTVPSTNGTSGNTTDEQTQRNTYVQSILKQLHDSDALIVAKQIEKQIYNKYKSINTDYRIKVRDILSNLHDNAELREQLIDGSTSAAQLIAMSYKQLADNTIQQRRNVDQLENIKDRTLDVEKQPNNDIGNNSDTVDSNDIITAVRNSDIAESDNDSDNRNMPALEIE